MSYDLVIHVNHGKPEEFQGALSNVEHYFARLPGESFEVAVLATGPAVNFFSRKNPEFTEKIAALMRKPHVSFYLCRNAMQSNHLTEADVLNGCCFVPAGIVELVRLQQAGYAYVKA